MIDYRREIDGLRALAVLPVIFFHGSIDGFEGGFVGVDVFFVISGYLITSIILKQKDLGAFTIISFYERRARRILPALFLVMATCVPLAWLWLLPNDMKDFSQSLMAVPIFVSNILFFHESEYFDTTAELKPLLHTWSLAVEEQYYVLFPLFFLFAWQLGKRWLLSSFFVIAILSLLLAQYGAYRYPAANFFLLPTRVWELMIGVFIAFHLNKEGISRVNNAISQCASILGVLLILFAVSFFSKDTPYPGFYALIPTFGAGLIILFALPNTIVGNVLGTKLFVGLGTLSYSAYLWHQPLFAFARQMSFYEPSRAEFIFLSCITFIIAYFSWRHVEIPFRNKDLVSRRMILILSIIFSLAFIALGLIGHAVEGNIGRLSNDKRYLDISYRLRGNYGLSIECEVTFSDSEKCRTSDNPEILLWGDSFAMHLAQGFVASNHDIRLIQATVSHCAPIIGAAPATAIHGAKNCLAGNDRVMEMLKSTPSIKYVILGSQTFLLGSSEIVTINGRAFSTPQEIEDLFLETLAYISSLGVKPIIFAPPPRSRENIGECIIKAETRGAPKSLCDFSLHDAESIQAEVVEMLHRVGKAYTVIWPSTSICKSGKCRAAIGEIYLYRDWGHLSYEGSALIGKQMNFYGLLE